MKMPALLDLDQFPDSPYARELRRASRGLRFAPDLEPVYQSFHLDRARTRVQLFHLGLLALLIAISLHLVFLDSASPLQVIHGWIGLATPLCVLLLGVSLSRWYGPLYLPAARFALPVFGVAAAVGIADKALFGAADPFYFLTTYGVALFFLGGLPFIEAALANALMIITHWVALVYLHQPAPVIAYSLAVLTITATIGGLVYRDVEQQLRTSFLERGLMGELAARDGLTGIKNRGAFDAHLPVVWGQAMRDRRPLALLMIDVDHFKAYNDLYGHQAGDQALCRVAQVVQGFARRPLDMAARYGGEEFVLALFDLNGEHVRDIAEQLRLSIQRLQIPHEDSSAAPIVTVSIGVSLVGPRQGRSPAGAVQLADEALYTAKRCGRNCVRFAEADPTFATGSFRRRMSQPKRSTG